MLTAASASPDPFSRRSNQARWTSSALMNPRFESSEPQTGVHGSCVHGHTTSRCSAWPGRAQAGVVVDRPAQEAVVPAGEVKRRDGDAASSRRRCSSAASSRRGSGGRASRGSSSEARGSSSGGRSQSGSVQYWSVTCRSAVRTVAEHLVVAVSAGGVVGEEERPRHRPAEEDRAVGVDPAVVGLRRGEPGADGGQAGRPRRRGEELHEAGIGVAVHADPAARLRQRGRPLDRVVAVVGLVQERDEVAVRRPAPAAVLHDDDVAVRGEPRRVVVPALAL